MSKTLILTGIVAFALMLGIAGNSDYEDAKAASALYEQYVCEGIHPDYKQLGVECE